MGWLPEVAPPPRTFFRASKDNAVPDHEVWRSRQTDPCSDAALARALIGAPGRGGILDPEPAAVKDHDLVRRGPAGPPAGDELAQFRMDIGLAHRTGAERVMQIAHDGALRAHVGNDA